MTIEVFDASALIAHLSQEAGADVVEERLDDPSSSCFVLAVNLCEVYYDTLKAAGEAVADQVISSLLKAGVEVREDMDEAFWKQVGRPKARGKISLNDCCCLTLVIRPGGRVVTSNHHEFEPLIPLGLCPILFIC